MLSCILLSALCVTLVTHELKIGRFDKECKCAESGEEKGRAEGEEEGEAP